MKIKELLTEKGFVEGVDYTLNGNILTLVVKTKTTTITIHHAAVPEVKDEQGNIITPGVDAYDEYREVEKEYTEEIPSVEALMRECILRTDYVRILNIYLAENTSKPEGDLNAELFVMGGDGWRITNVPAPSIEHIYSMIETLEKKIAQEKRVKENEAIGGGNIARCERVLKYINGVNDGRELTFEQITQMQNTFAETQEALRSGRDDFALFFINNIVPDGEIITEEIKQDCLDILAGRI